MTEAFKIAHLTDAHLPTHGRLAMSELIGKRALSAMNWLRSRRFRHVREIADALRADVMAHCPDHVAMTGDVVNFGLPREFVAGADWLQGFGASEAVSFVPGNHEAIQSGVEAMCDRAFSAFTTSDDGTPGWPYLRRRGPVALIGVTTSIATPPGFAQGRVGDEQIVRLRERLIQAKGSCRIILIHHTPTHLTTPRKHLVDRIEVAKAIAEGGAELVLHGHNHKSQLSWIDAIEGARIPVLGAPAASGPPGGAFEPAEWRRISVSPEEDGYRIDVLRRTIAKGGATFEDRGRFSFPPA